MRVVWSRCEWYVARGFRLLMLCLSNQNPQERSIFFAANALREIRELKTQVGVA